MRSDRAAQDAAIIRHWLAEVSKAAAAFERRWTAGALKRVDAGLFDRLSLQRSDFDRAIVTGAIDDVEKQGAATCRGYAVCVKALEQSGEADDAYVLGFDSATGYRIAIGNQRASADRVQELHGNRIVHYTADEIAALLASMEGLKRLSAIKTIWPGSELIDIYPEEPAKADSEAA